MRPPRSTSMLQSVLRLFLVSVILQTSGIATAILLAPPIRLAAQGINFPPSRFNPRSLAPLPGQRTSLMQQEIRLAGDYLAGRGVPKDPVQAAYWYQKAADQGDPDAQNQVGYLYMWGIGVNRDPSAAFRWYARAAGSGCQGAKLNLAVMYFKGVGTPRDVPLAVDLMTELAEKGNARAQGYLGILYLSGAGMPANPALAEKWLGKAARGKNPEAEYSMGVLWSTASDHEHDPAKAVKFFRNAAHRGYVPAMSALGLFLEQHPAIAPNPPDEAVIMLERAAEAGSWASSAALGALARDGHERPQSFADAFRWFTIATRQGGVAAAESTHADLDRCRHALNADEQAAELDAATAWLTDHPHIDVFLFTGPESSQFPIDEVYTASSGGQ